MIIDHGIEYPTPPGTHGFVYDAGTGRVRPRGDGAISARWGVVAALLALTLLAGAIACPIATQAPIYRVASDR